MLASSHEDVDLFKDQTRSKCSRCCSCVKNCFRSIPLGSLIAALLAAVGFSLSIKGWVKTADAFKNAGLDMGSIEGYVGYALAATLVLDMLVLLLAVCSTGRTREACLRGDSGGKTCGRCCVRFWNTMFAALCYLSILWNIVLVLIFTLLLIVEFIMSELCTESSDVLNELDIHMTKFGFGFNLDSAQDFENFCTQTKPIVGDMVLMFAGSLVSACAQINMLVNVCVNFVRVGYESKLHKAEDTRKYSMPFLQAGGRE